MSRPRARAESFAAIDFETANHDRDSACAVGVVRVEDGRIAARHRCLIRPPTAEFHFTNVHGLGWDDVRDAPDFAAVWDDLGQWLDGVGFLAAHNAAFDRGVLRASCRRYGLRPRPYPFVCTVALAREVWRLFPTKLPDVCRHLGIPLRHHDPASDAEACARIVLAAREIGWRR